MSEPVVSVEPNPRRVRATFAGETIADSTDALLLYERGHQPVHYLPVADVRMDLLEPTDHHTHCPQKGQASYYSIRVSDRVAENAVWRYEHPIAGCPDISGHVAFYADRVDSLVEDA
jgi:uncharacterized protein (DUF427 family)